MACNVYLAFFKHYDTKRLRMLEWKYLLLCYGLPFIPAFVYLFVSSETRGKVYGDAVVSLVEILLGGVNIYRHQLWCWVSLPWDFLQIAVFYGPVWFIVVVILAIYLRVGLSIRQQRRELNIFVMPDFEHATDTTVLGDVDLPGTIQPVPLDSFRWHSNRQRSPPFTPNSSHPSISPEIWHTPSHAGPPNAPPGRASFRSYNITRTSTSDSRQASEAYFKYAVLFLAALIVTWVRACVSIICTSTDGFQVPSSANRVSALAASNHYVFGLSCASSFALPLQGFWNSLIYITVSWQAILAWFRHVGAQARRTSSTTLGPLKSSLRRLSRG
jgi:hypothetical protein